MTSSCPNYTPIGYPGQVSPAAPSAVSQRTPRRYGRPAQPPLSAPVQRRPIRPQARRQCPQVAHTPCAQPLPTRRWSDAGEAAVGPSTPAGDSGAPDRITPCHSGLHAVLSTYGHGAPPRAPTPPGPRPGDRRGLWTRCGHPRAPASPLSNCYNCGCPHARLGNTPGYQQPSTGHPQTDPHGYPQGSAGAKRRCRRTAIT